MATTKKKPFNSRITKTKMLALLIDIAEDVHGDDIKASDKIRAIQQICLMEGYNQATETIVTNKTFTLDF